MTRLLILILSVLTIFAVSSCKNEIQKRPARDNGQEMPQGDSLLLVGKDIITEVIVRPDTLGDPWEAEKVENYRGMAMYNAIFQNAYTQRVPVYNIITGEPMTPRQLKDMEKEFVSDYSMIGKLQFVEDWYFDPLTNKFIKIIKSVSFGYEGQREAGLPSSYRAMFKIIPE